MTTIGENRNRYAATHPEDRRPSRFHEVEAYAAWAARADAWALAEGLPQQGKRRKVRQSTPEPRRMVRVSADTWMIR